MRPRVSKTRLPATGTLEQSAMPEGATSPRLGSRQSTEFSLGDLRARRSVSLTGGRNSLELVEVDGFAGAPTGTDMAAGAHGEEAFRVGAPPGGVEDSLHEGLPSLSEGAPRKPSGLLYTLYVSKAWRVYPTLMLLYMGITVLVPIQPTFVTDFFARRRSGIPSMTCFGPTTDEPLLQACQDAHVDAVTWSGWRDFVSLSVVGFVLTPVVGRLSDTLGRRRFIVVSSSLHAMPAVVFFLSARNVMNFLWYYPAAVLAKAIDINSLAVALTADVVPPAQRGAAIGFVIGCLALSFLLGPAVAATLDVYQISWLSLALAVAAPLWAFAMVPETTTEASRISARHEKLQQQQNRHPLALGGFIATWRVLTRSRLFVTLTVLIMAVGLAQEGLQDLLLQYLQLKVDFGPKDNVEFLILFGVGGLGAQLILLPILVKLIGEKWVLVVSLFAQALSQAMFASAARRGEVWAAVGVSVLSTMAFPAISAIKSNNSAEHEQGSVQGALFGAKSFATGTGPLIYAWIFSAFTSTDSPLPFLPGAPFAFGAMLLFLCTMLACALPKGCSTGPLLVEVGNDTPNANAAAASASAVPGRTSAATFGSLAPNDTESGGDTEHLLLVASPPPHEDGGDTGNTRDR